MKYIHSAVILITAMVLMLFSSLTGYADITNLYTSVPGQVTVNVIISGNGAVTVNGQKITGNGVVLAERLENVTVSVSADLGNVLKSIHLDGADITDRADNGILTIERISFDTTLEVVFQPDAAYRPDNPKTGDNTLIFLYSLCFVTSVLLLCYLCWDVFRKQQET